MFGLPIAFLAGYFVARYFGDAIKEIVHRVYTEVAEWL